MSLSQRRREGGMGERREVVILQEQEPWKVTQQHDKAEYEVRSGGLGL